MDILQITETQFINTMLVFIRISGLLFTAPLFGEKIIPTKVRLLLSLIIALSLTPLLQLKPWPMTPEPLVLVLAVLGELLIGLIIGFSAKLLFDGVQLSGQLIGYQMGFGVANVLDPLSGAQVSLFGQAEMFVALLLFLSLNAHHLFFRAMVESYRLIPPFDFHPHPLLVNKIMSMAGQMFVIAVQIGAPTIAVLLFTNVFFALMARTVPEMNIFIVAMPIGIAVGIFIFSLSMPMVSSLLNRAFSVLQQDLIVLMKGM